MDRRVLLLAVLLVLPCLALGTTMQRMMSDMGIDPHKKADTLNPGSSPGSEAHHAWTDADMKCWKDSGFNPMPYLNKADKTAFMSIAKSWVSDATTPRFSEVGAGKDCAKILPKKKATKIYQLMKDWDDLCQKHGVKYFIVGGTLLGSVRGKGLIPWDDDVDVGIYADQKEAIQGMEADMESIGYKLWNFPNDQGFKMYDAKGCTIPSKDYLYPFLDVFVYSVDSAGKTYFAQDTRWANCYMYKSEIGDMSRMYEFGELSLPGPNKPGPGLTRCYTKNYMKFARVGMDHQNWKEQGSGECDGDIPIGQLPNSVDHDPPTDRLGGDDAASL